MTCAGATSARLTPRLHFVAQARYPALILTNAVTLPIARITKMMPIADGSPLAELTEGERLLLRREIAARLAKKQRNRREAKAASLTERLVGWLTADILARGPR